MRDKTHIFGVVIISFLLIMYLWFTVERAIALFKTGSLLSNSMAIALIILPVIGAWALVREIIFGIDSSRLLKKLDQEGLIPEENIPTLPSGKPSREDAAGILPKYESQAKDQPESWQQQMRLGIVLDAAGKRSNARAAIRNAINISRGRGKL